MPACAAAKASASLPAPSRLTTAIAASPAMKPTLTSATRNVMFDDLPDIATNPLCHGGCFAATMRGSVNATSTLMSVRRRRACRRGGPTKGVRRTPRRSRIKPAPRSGSPDGHRRLRPAAAPFRRRPNRRIANPFRAFPRPRGADPGRRGLSLARSGRQPLGRLELAAGGGGERALARRPRRRRIGGGRARRDPDGQRRRLRLRRPGGAGARSGHRPAARHRQSRQRRLHHRRLRRFGGDPRQRRLLAPPRARARRLLRAEARRRARQAGRSDRRRQARRARRRLARRGGGEGRARAAGLARRSGGDRLHLGDDRPAEGRDAVARQRRRQRSRVAPKRRRLAGRRLSLVSAAVAHVRAHRRLLPADRRRRDGRLRTVGGASRRGHAQRPADDPDLGAAHLRARLSRHPRAPRQRRDAGADVERARRAHRLESVRTGAGDRARARRRASG